MLAAFKLRFHNYCGKQPEFALHRWNTLLLAITESLTDSKERVDRGLVCGDAIEIPWLFSLFRFEKSLFFEIFSLLLCVGNCTRCRCGTASSRYKIGSESPEFAIFPV